MKQSQILVLFGSIALATVLSTICVSAGAQSIAASKPAACVDSPPYDTTPYKAVRFVKVAPRVNLEVLDWGGSGEVMVLLTGLGDNAHVYDYFAFQFTDFFHVIGITRRGYLPSSQPERGYDVDTRATDDIKVLDTLGIKKAVFVGHSLAGSELSKIAVKYPSYVDKLVYLDASDISERQTFPDIPFPSFTDADLKSLFTFQATNVRLLATREPIPAVCLSLEFDKDGSVTGTSTPDSIREKLLEGAILPAHPPTNWADIKQPRLGIVAPPTAESKVPFYSYLSPADQALFDERFPRLLQWYSDVIDKFAEKHPGSPTPVVYLLPGAPHYVYVNHEAEVVLQMRNFLGIPLDAPEAVIPFATIVGKARSAGSTDSGRSRD
jgi:pimeloyl-ACP methyl ester carboxylesterase